MGNGMRCSKVPRNWAVVAAVERVWAWRTPREMTSRAAKLLENHAGRRAHVRGLAGGKNREVQALGHGRCVKAAMGGQSERAILAAALLFIIAQAARWYLSGIYPQSMTCGNRERPTKDALPASIFPCYRWARMLASVSALMARLGGNSACEGFREWDSQGEAFFRLLGQLIQEHLARPEQAARTHDPPDYLWVLPLLPPPVPDIVGCQRQACQLVRHPQASGTKQNYDAHCTISAIL
jgi:hypothetical protein